MVENTDLHTFMQSTTNLKLLSKLKATTFMQEICQTNNLKKVFDWLAGNADWAKEVFYELNPELL